jgi:hypothetical protein
LQTVAERTHRAAPQGSGRILTQGGLVVRPWEAGSSNVERVAGRVLWDDAPVAGAQVVVDDYAVPQATAKDGSFGYDADITVPLRHVVRIGSLRGARVRGKPLTAEQQRALRRASGGFSVGYGAHALSAHVQKDGSVVVTGRLGGGPPAVHLLTYRLAGTITDASGKPVQGAVVITRTQDRDFWTHSSASDAQGHYASFFAASDETAADPVSISLGVALGAVSYGGNVGTNVSFARLKSATANIQLGASTNYTVQAPASSVGAVYSGLVLGVRIGDRVVKPLAERWPDARGTFSFRLPPSVRGRTLTLWENVRQSFSRMAQRTGGPVDLSSWPTQLGDAVPTGLATLKIPHR